MRSQLSNPESDRAAELQAELLSRAFVGGLVYGAGMLGAKEILKRLTDDELGALVCAVATVEPPELELTGAELCAEHWGIL